MTYFDDLEVGESFTLFRDTEVWVKEGNFWARNSETGERRDFNGGDKVVPLL
jgi:hypothetical protein